jgi:hypothetical protein
VLPILAILIDIAFETSLKGKGFQSDIIAAKDNRGQKRKIYWIWFNETDSKYLV